MSTNMKGVQSSSPTVMEGKAPFPRLLENRGILCTCALPKTSSFVLDNFIGKQYFTPVGPDCFFTVEVR